MKLKGMILKILLPSEIFAYEENVRSIVIETQSGSYGILPHRLDCVSILVPGVLTYQLEDVQNSYLAIDEGMIVKTGQNVVITTHNAIRGNDLSQLKTKVIDEFIQIDEQEKSIRTIMAKMESSFLQRFAQVRNG